MTYSLEDLKVTPTTSIKLCLEKINNTGLSTLLVLNKFKKLIGTLSDGDIRRALLKNVNNASQVQWNSLHVQ